MPDWIYRTIAEGNLMRIKYVGAQNFTLIITLWILLCWAFGASAAEKWNAKVGIYILFSINCVSFLIWKVLLERLIDGIKSIQVHRHSGS